MKDNNISRKDYYAQFVNASVLQIVSSFIGKDEIRNSKCEHFNDIPLKRWDGISQMIRQGCGRALGEANGSGGSSLSDCVCVAKAAARQIKEAN
jgi:hypothetical protein